MMIGIDCGIAITGWAIMKRGKNRRLKNIGVVDYGVIETKAGCKLETRLDCLYKDLLDIIEEYKPDQAAVESLFYFKNQKTVINVAQARGVTLLALERSGLEIYHYTPLQVKQAVTGYGKATKKQMQKMVKSILELKSIPKPDDAADALAIGVCHLNSI